MADPGCRSPSLRLLSALLQLRSGDGCAPRAGQSGDSRRRPVRRRLVGPRLLSGTKAEGGEEKRRKRRGCGERKKAQTAVTDRLGERSGAQAARRLAGLPLWLGPPGLATGGGVREEDGLARDSSAWRLAAGEGSGGSGACCHLAGRALLCSAGSLRAELLLTSLFTLLCSPSPSPVLNHQTRRRSPNPLAGLFLSKRGAHRPPQVPAGA